MVLYLDDQLNDVNQIEDRLNNFPGILDWSVDLEDREKVLRIECKDISVREITSILRKEMGFHG